MHSGSSLLPSLLARLGAAAEAWLSSRGCKVRTHLAGVCVTCVTAQPPKRQNRCYTTCWGLRGANIGFEPWQQDFIPTCWPGPPSPAFHLARWCPLHVQVILNDRLDVPEGASGGAFTGCTRGGCQVDCDVLLPATGITLNSSFMQPHLADALDNQGRIKVSGRSQCTLKRERTAVLCQCCCVVPPYLCCQSTIKG